MLTWTPHGRPAIDALAHAGYLNISEQATPSGDADAATLAELHQRTAVYARYAALTPDGLPASLKAEAEVVAGEIASDLDVLRQFWADLHRSGHMLTAEDRSTALDNWFWVHDDRWL